MYAKHRYPEFEPADRERRWSAVRARPAGYDAAHRQPLQYALWCDFLEDPDTVAEARAAVAGADAPPALLRAVLPVSGPVPYPLKAPVYERLIGEPTWHDTIFEGLIGSAFDVYGNIDRKAAARLLSRIELRPERSHVADLRAKLA